MCLLIIIIIIMFIIIHDYMCVYMNIYTYMYTHTEHKALKESQTDPRRACGCVCVNMNLANIHYYICILTCVYNRDNNTHANT